MLIINCSKYALVSRWWKTAWFDTFYRAPSLVPHLSISQLPRIVFLKVSPTILSSLPWSSGLPCTLDPKSFMWLRNSSLAFTSVWLTSPIKSILDDVTLKFILCWASFSFPLHWRGMGQGSLSIHLHPACCFKAEMSLSIYITPVLTDSTPWKDSLRWGWGVQLLYFGSAFSIGQATCHPFTGSINWAQLVAQLSLQCLAGSFYRCQSMMLQEGNKQQTELFYKMFTQMSSNSWEH